jgi:hypothetical protein
MQNFLVKHGLTLVFIILNCILYSQDIKNSAPPIQGKFESAKIDYIRNGSYYDFNNLPKFVTQNNINCDCLCGKSNGKVISLVTINALLDLSSKMQQLMDSIEVKNLTETTANKISDKEIASQENSLALGKQVYGVNDNLQLNSVVEKMTRKLIDGEIQEKQETIARLTTKKPKAIASYHSIKSISNGEEKEQIELLYLDSAIIDTVIFDFGEKKLYNSISIDKFNKWLIEKIQENDLIIRSNINTYTIEICYEKKKILEQNLNFKEKMKDFDEDKFKKKFYEELEKIEKE